MSATIKTDTTAIDGLLAQLPVIERDAAIVSGMREGGDVLAEAQRSTAPRMAGATKDVLAGSIAKRIVNGDRRVLAIVGPRVTAGHARWVEEGHRIVTHAGVDTGRLTKPQPFVAPSVQRAGPAAVAAVERGVAKAVERAIRG